MMKPERSPLEREVVEILRRARSLPVGPDRNDLRQLAVGLLWLHRKGMATLFGTYRPEGHGNERLVAAMSDGTVEKNPAE